MNDSFTVIQAALLIIDVEPSGEQDYVLNNNPQNRPPHFDATYSALINAIKSEKLKAQLEYEQDFGGDTPNWSQSLINAKDLQPWLSTKPIKSVFFNVDNINTATGISTNTEKKHTSELLGILDHAITDLWEGKNTDIKNEAIMKWFADNYQDHNGLSEKVKGSMCTIMRPFKYK